MYKIDVRHLKCRDIPSMQSLGGHGKFFVVNIDLTSVITYCTCINSRRTSVLLKVAFSTILHTYGKRVHIDQSIIFLLSRNT